MIDYNIKKLIIAKLDSLFDELAEAIFIQLNNGKDASEHESDEIESIFMSYRNVIAGTDWDGALREYEKYEVGE